MATLYPNQIDTTTQLPTPSGTTVLSDGTADHAAGHSNISSAIIAIENTIGTTGGTNVLKNFVAGDFSVRMNTGGTLQQSIVGTFNNTTFGTPTIKVGGDQRGDVYYQSSAGTITNLPPGTSGQFLQTKGTGASPIWANPVFAAYQIGTTTNQSTTSSSYGNLTSGTVSIPITNISNAVAISHAVARNQNTSSIAYFRTVYNNGTTDTLIGQETYLRSTDNRQTPTTSGGIILTLPIGTYTFAMQGKVDTGTADYENISMSILIFPAV